MKGTPNSYISTSAPYTDGLVAQYYGYRSFDDVNEQAMLTLSNMGVLSKASANCIVRLNEDHLTYDVVVRVHTKGGAFIHSERWEDFPSDHFKAKVLLVCG